MAIYSEIWSSVRNNRLRTALTGFAVSWGIFLLICLLGAGNGLMNAITGNMSDYLSNSITVYARNTSISYGGYQKGRRIRLNNDDIATTKGSRFSANVDDVTAQVYYSGLNVSRGDKYINADIIGAGKAYGDIYNIRIAHGRFLNQNDEKEIRKVVVISTGQAKELLGGNADMIHTLVGQYVNVGNLAFRVVGLYQSDESGMDSDIFAPFQTVRSLYGFGDRVHNLAFTFHGLETIDDNNAFEDRYKRALNANHSAAPEDKETFWIRNRFTENIQMNKAKDVINTALWILGILTLISGIVGVSNIMLISVKERTHEFGIRKAIGAKPRQILSLIIAESVAITAAFGYVGMFLGMIACQVMDKTIGQDVVNIGFEEIHMLKDPTVGLDVAFEATLLLVIAGTIAGLIPAYKASRVRPIEALRAD